MGQMPENSDDTSVKEPVKKTLTKESFFFTKKVIVFFLTKEMIAKGDNTEISLFSPS